MLSEDNLFPPSIRFDSLNFTGKAPQAQVHIDGLADVVRDDVDEDISWEVHVVDVVVVVVPMGKNAARVEIFCLAETARLLESEDPTRVSSPSLKDRSLIRRNEGKLSQESAGIGADTSGSPSSCIKDPFPVALSNILRKEVIGE